MQPQDLHPSGQRVGEGRHQQDLRRAGEQEASGRAPEVYLLLQGGEEGGDALHLVKDRPLAQAADEAGRIGLGGGAGDTVVKADVAVSPEGLPRRGASVVLPDCRGPCMSTAGESPSDSARERSA